MALSYTQVLTIATGNQTYLQQMATALYKQAAIRIVATAPAPTAPEIALCAALIKSAPTYAPRFLLDALLTNAAALTSTNGSSIDVPIADSAMDAAIIAMWPAQVAAGV